MREIKSLTFLCLLVSFIFSSSLAVPQEKEEQALLQVMHSISSNQLYEYVKELASDKYTGRLTGTEGYNQAAQWVVSKFKKWGISPAGDNGTYLRSFPLAYTRVFKGSEVFLHLPYKSATIEKHYTFDDQFIPGSTSGSGEVTAEVVYVGYGITAPELDYDDYQGVDVEEKIVMMEREVPVSPQKDPEIFKKWRPYSFHQYKLENAVAHGAKGMLYNYGPIANPNNAYSEGFIYSHVGEAVVHDVFAGSGKKHIEVVEKIKKTLQPQSFNTGKVFTIKNTTKHYLGGTGYNVIGLIKGTDPQLQDELIIIGAHLDHVGRCYEIMPGANDNASGVSVILGLAEALSKSPVKLRRSVMVLCFGAEEQGVLGSKYYLENPTFPLEKTKAFINMDGVGCGDKLRALAAQNYPQLWSFIKTANQKYIHRIINPRYFDNIARPRLDAARFMWHGVPTVSFSAYGAPSFYHNTKDDIDTITPEILEDLAQLLFMSVVKMVNQDSLDFRE